MVHDLLYRRRISAQCFDQLWGIFRWSIVSELSSPASSPFQPLVKPTLCASDSFDDIFCHSCPVQPLRCKYLRCNLETIKFFVDDSHILHKLFCCYNSNYYNYKLCGFRHQVSPENWCLPKKLCRFTPWWNKRPTFEIFHTKLLQILTCRPIIKCVLFRIQSILSY